MVYEDEDLETEVNQRIEQFQKGLITLRELIDCLDKCEKINHTLLLNRILKTRTDKK